MGSTWKGSMLRSNLAWYFVHLCIIFWFDWFGVFFSFLSYILFRHRILVLLCACDAHISTLSLIHIGFIDGASHYTQNLTSPSWVIYSPTDEFLSSWWIYLGHATNNFVEYCVFIGILTKEIYLNISQLIVNLDSQLMVFQLNRIYTIYDPILFWLFLRVRFLERSFEFIQYQHILREFNQVLDSLSNYILDWHLAHIWQSKY